MADSNNATLARDLTLNQRASLMNFQAATAVLETNKLLHLILSEVPRVNRISLCRVSKTWKTAVHKIGYVFEPVAYSPLFSAKHPSLPVYPSEAHNNARGLKMNPETHGWETLFVNTTHQDPGIDAVGCMIDEDFQDLAPYALEFLTRPPVTQAMIAKRSDEPGCWASREDVAVQRVPGGIRVGDMVECLFRMKVAATPDDHFTGWFGIKERGKRVWR